MKNKPRLKKIGLASRLIAITMPLLFLSSCWDNKELDTLSIVSAIGLDSSDSPERINLIVQLGNVKSSSKKEKDSDKSSDKPVILKENTTNILTAIDKMRCQNSRSIFLHQNQIIVLGNELSSKGVADYFDAFLRNNDTRSDVLVFVADEKAEDILAASPEFENSSADVLARMIGLEKKVSEAFGISVLKFSSNIVSEVTATAIPIVKIKESENEKNKISFSGLAVFQNDTMVGELKDDDVYGFLLLSSGVSGGAFNVALPEGDAALHIQNVTPQKSVTISQDGEITLHATISGDISIGELHGFEDMDLSEVFKLVENASSQKLSDIITNTFETSLELNADLFEVGVYMHRHLPKKFDKIKDNWENIYPDVKLDLKLELKLTGTGQISQSLKMGEPM